MKLSLRCKALLFIWMVRHCVWSLDVCSTWELIRTSAGSLCPSTFSLSHLILSVSLFAEWLDQTLICFSSHPGTRVFPNNRLFIKNRIIPSKLLNVTLTRNIALSHWLIWGFCCKFIFLGNVRFHCQLCFHFLCNPEAPRYTACFCRLENWVVKWRFI